jgi:hypothetical protein
MLATVAAVTFAVLTTDEPTTLIFALPVVVVPFVITLWWLNRFINHNQLPQLQRASDMMRAVQPRPVRIRSGGYGDLSGISVEIRAADADEESTPWAVATVRASNRTFLRKKSVPARLYYRQEGDPSFLVLETDKMVLWGHLSNPARRATSWRRFGWLFGGFLALVLIGVVVVAMLYAQQMRMVNQDIELAQTTLSWPRADGVVTASAVRSVRIHQGKGTVPGFKNEIRYQYFVNGQTFNGRVIHLGYRPTRDRAEAEALAAKYPEGAAVRPAYDPHLPRRSVLEPGHMDDLAEQVREMKTSLMTLFAVIAAALIAVTILFLYISRQKRNLDRVQGGPIE